MSPQAREHSFDELTRGLASGSITRGKALRLMGAALVGGTLASLGIGEAGADPPGCKRNGKVCTKDKVCCSGNCVNGTCSACPAGTTLCGGNCVTNCSGRGQGLDPDTCRCTCTAKTTGCGPNFNRVACPTPGAQSCCEQWETVSGTCACVCGLECLPDGASCTSDADCVGAFGESSVCLSGPAQAQGDPSCGCGNERNFCGFTGVC